jgi:ketosteroid isomerase-like protein
MAVAGTAALLRAACRGASVQALTDAQRTAVTEGVRTLLANYQDAVNSGELDRIMAFYADDPDFHWVENGAIAYDSYEAVATAFEGLQSQVEELHLELGDPRIAPLTPGLASVTVPAHQLFQSSSGDRFEVDMMITLTAVRRDRGWQFLTGHASQPRPRLQ